MKTSFIIGVVLLILSGAAYGVHETICWHYPKFQAKFPTANELYWNPYKSWENKCKTGEGYNPDVKCVPRFIGATTFLAFTTDAKHFYAELRFWLLVVGILFLVRRARLDWWWVLPAAGLAVYVLHSVGFHLVYTFYF